MATISQAKPQAIVEIERLGYKYTEDGQYDLSGLSTERRVQVREPRHYAPKAEVERYAIQMGHSKFPPIIVTRDQWIIDGNTRVGGALKRGDRFFPAYIVQIDWKDATPRQRQELYAIGATMNAANGNPLTPAERRESVRNLLGLEWTEGQIERVAGIKPVEVKRVKRDLIAEKRAAQVGLEVTSPEDGRVIRNGGTGAVSGAAKRALGQSMAADLHDEPFLELAKLAADAGLGAAEVTQVARAAKEASSDAEALRAIAEARAEAADRIRQRELTGKSKPSPAAQFRQALGHVLRFAGQEYTLVERNPDLVGQYDEAITQALTVISKVMEAQDAFEQTS